MNGRLRRLEQLRHLRSLQEMRREADFVRSRIRLERVEQGMKAGGGAQRLAIAEAMRAVEEGNRLDLTMAEKMRQVALQSMVALRPVQDRATQEMAAARDKFTRSKRETEQAGLLAAGVLGDLQRDLDRKSQAESDDRYASRRNWLQRGSVLQHKSLKSG